MRSSILTCLLALCPPAPLAAAEIPEWFRVFSEPVKASMLIGKEVRSREGDYLGTVGDLVLDLEHNRVHRAIVARPEGHSGYPLHLLKTPPGGAHLVLEPPEDQVEQTWDDMRLVRASKLFAGPVLDVVLDAFWGHVAFAVMEVEGALRPVPLDAFALEAGEPVLRVERRKVAALDGFTSAQLDAHLRDREFLQRKARDAHRLTPLAP